jgi:hypothetical protein
LIILKKQKLAYLPKNIRIKLCFYDNQDQSY